MINLIKDTKTRQYWSLEDTFSGYLLNELKFCSNSALNGFNYDSCPIDCVTRNSMFWNAASADFAKKASGYINVILNGTRTIGALSNTSTFLNYELPNFSSSNVKQVKVLLLHSPDQQKYETCSAPKSLVTLSNLLKQKNIDYACEDNPTDILLLMCFYDPFSKECQAIKYLLNSSRSYLKFNYSILLFIFLFYFLF